MPQKSFLAQKYPDLDKTLEVKSAVREAEKNGELIPNDPDAKIDAFLDRLEQVFNDPDQEKRTKAIHLLKVRMYKEFVIKPENVPETYFANQQRIARERGYGDLDFTDEEKQMATEMLIKDQKTSLDGWFDYLTDPNEPYETWFRFYVLRNIVGMSEFDKNKQEFKKRTKFTTTLFPDLNRGALGVVYSGIKKSYQKNENTGDQKFDQLLKTANFNKLYSYQLIKATEPAEDESITTDGEWITYEQGTSGEKLAKSLEGHKTAWCTRGEETATTQLAAGNFHVYYTYDKSGKPTVPRIAIRMEQDRIAEIRGVASNDQDLEPQMMSIAEARAKDMQGWEDYTKKTSDMKRITEIDRKTINGEELSADELKFLYEVDVNIEGFGYKKDPRIRTIIAKRNKVEDLSQIFGIQKEKIATSIYQLDDETELFVGDLSLNGKEHFPTSLKILFGDLSINYCGFKTTPNLQKIYGGAYISVTGSQDSSELLGMPALDEVRQDLFIGATSKITNLGSLKKVGKQCVIQTPVTVDLNKLEYVGDDLMLWGDLQYELPALKKVAGNIYVLATVEDETGVLYFDETGPVQTQEEIDRQTKRSAYIQRLSKIGRMVKLHYQD